MSVEAKGRLLAVIVPMLNEEAGAVECVETICGVLARKLSNSLLIVVDDGSSDGTAGILNELARSHDRLVVLHHDTNRGYGAALVTGAREALRRGYAFGLFMDSDLTNDPGLIPRFHERVARGDCDLVKASRYVPGGGMSGVPWRRQLPSILGNRVASRLFGLGVRDCTNGFRAVRLSLYEGLRFEERGFPQIMEELYLLKQKGVRAAEIPYVLTSRSDDRESSFSYRAPVLWAYLKYALLSATDVPSDRL